MPDYKAPLRDIQFVLHDVFNAEETWAQLPGSGDVNRELADAILEECAKVAEGVLSPLNRSGDEAGLVFDNGTVTVPEGFKEGWDTLAQGGWFGLTGPEQYGGQNMPKMLALLYEEMMYSGNLSLFLCGTLTMGAALLLEEHATQEIKDFYLPRLYSGEWGGTMCLTESHAGTDLGMIRTKAEPQADGTYSITGNKIFISGGEHNMTDNIVHLVLAKLPDAPAGSKGISLFLVSKFNHDDDGNLQDNNNVSCGSIEHKMGIHACPTCVMNFDGARGLLIGEVNKGLAAMFTMMNYERLGVGVQGTACAANSLQWSLEYANERLQSRAPAGKKNPDGPADPILHHPDVRRMLLTQKALVEAGRALSVYVGKQLDLAKWGEGEVKQTASNRVQLLTPIAKAFFTDMGLDCTVMGQQVYGGHGYIREWGMEQMVRDVRIAQIYEGTNGIQALDLMGRKVAANKGSGMADMIDEIRDWAAEQNAPEVIEPMQQAVSLLDDVTQWVVDQTGNDPDAIGAASVEYLHLTGYTLYAWMWAKMSIAAAGDDDFAQAKRHTAQFYMQRLLPRTEALAKSIRAGSEPLMAMPAELLSA